MASIVVCSGKGGTGKTQTVINLGAALAQFGADVCIVDGNLPTPDISLYFDVPSETKTLNDVIKGKASIEEATFIHEKTGLKIIPASIKLNSIAGLEKTLVSKTLEELKNHSKIVLLDSAPGLGAEVVQVAKTAKTMIVVTNPEIAALTDSYKTIQLAKAMDVDVIGVLLTRTGRFKGEPSKRDVATFFGNAPLIGSIPEDKSVPLASLKSLPVVIAFPNSPAAIAYKKVAAEMLGVKYEEEVRISLWQRILSFFKI